MLTGQVPAIEVENLSKDFGRFRAVDRISFTVRAGEIFGFLGPNGAGKSTTIRMLTGLLLPSGGSGRVAGLDIVRENYLIQHHIGYMSQRFSLYEDLTAEENLTFFGGVYGLRGSHLKERIDAVLILVDLAGRRQELTRNLSLGLRQRLALASAVLHEPAILFLDEPTSGVDPISRRTFWDLIYGLAERGVTVLVTTHYLDEAEFCDQLVLIHQGRLVAQGTPRDLKRLVTQEIIAVYPERLGEALEILHNFPEIGEASVFGDGLHVTTTQAGQGEDAIKAVLAANQIGIRSLSLVPATLEDAFIFLTRQAGTNKQ